MRCSETCDLYTFWGGPILFWGVGHESYFFRGGVSDFVTVGGGGGGGGGGPDFKTCCQRWGVRFCPRICPLLIWLPFLHMLSTVLLLLLLFAPPTVYKKVSTYKSTAFLHLKL